jgi:hypothetical protein
MRKKKTEMESEGKQFMLFMFGDFVDNESFVLHDVSYQLITVVSSKFMKFNYGEFGMVINFRTKETFEDLKEYVDMCMNEIVEQYFLMEVTSNIDIKMEQKLKRDFLNIDGVKKPTKTKGVSKDDLTEEKKKRISGMMEFIFPLTEGEIKFPFNREEKKEKPTVDQILDKISEEGIESLTEEEKQILDNYGKREDRGN